MRLNSTTVYFSHMQTRYGKTLIMCIQWQRFEPELCLPIVYKWNSEGEIGQPSRKADGQNNASNQRAIIFQIFLIWHSNFSSVYLAFGNNLMG